MEKERRNQKTKSVGNGEGSFYKSEALGCYVFQYVHNGKRKTMKQKKNESIRDFRKRVTEIKNQKDNGTLIENNKETFISILENYIEQKHKDGITSDRSYKRDLETMKQIKNTCIGFIDKPIQKIKIEDIEDCKESIRKYSNSVINKIWTQINKTFQIAYSRRKIPFNIMLDETLTKPISERPEQKIEALTTNEETKLIDILNNQEINHKYRNIILLQLYTGMRIGEILALSKDCIDLKNNTLTVYRTLTQDLQYKVIMGEHTKTFKKKTGIDNGKRTFPMNSKVKSVITEILKDKTININGLLFWNYNKGTFITPNEVNSYLNRINEKYSITPSSLHTHRLRHTFITRCVENGVILRVIQSLVGHIQDSTITSDVYTSISKEFMAKELEKIN